MGDKGKLDSLCGKNYKEQSIWFLNAFWKSFGEKEAENIWKRAHELSELDNEKKAEGNGVDELQAHRFLEKLHETMTVQTMREKLRSSGALGPQDRPKVVPLTHYLIIRYNIDWKKLVNAPQGNSEEIAKAQKMLDEVNSALAEAQSKAEEAAEALRQSKAAEAKAIKAEEQAKSREAKAKQTEAVAIQREEEAIEAERPLKEAQEELQAALNDLHHQETSYKNKTDDLKKRSEEGGAVTKNKAKAELEIHLKEDPLPLRRAKITTEAAERKADKLRAPFKIAREKAEEARSIAEAAREEAEQARKAAESAREEAEEAARESEAAAEAAEQALNEARERVAEAEAYLEEAKSRNPEGSIWWLQRELAEAKKYMPASKGGVKK